MGGTEQTPCLEGERSEVTIIASGMKFHHPLLLVDIHFLGAISLQLFHLITLRLHYHYATLDPPPFPTPLKTTVGPIEGININSKIDTVVESTFREIHRISYS